MLPSKVHINTDMNIYSVKYTQFSLSIIAVIRSLSIRGYPAKRALSAMCKHGG